MKWNTMDNNLTYHNQVSIFAFGDPRTWSLTEFDYSWFPLYHIVRQPILKWQFSSCTRHNWSIKAYEDLDSKWIISWLRPDASYILVKVSIRKRHSRMISPLSVAVSSGTRISIRLSIPLVTVIPVIVLNVSRCLILLSLASKR